MKSSILLPILLILVTYFAGLATFTWLSIHLFSEEVFGAGSLVTVLVVVYLLAFISIWAYLAAVLANPGRIDSSLMPPCEVIAKGRQWQVGKGNYCMNCSSERPERAHHCRECGTCIRRMDHHCVYIGQCVGIGNHRFFLQWLFYVIILLATMIIAIIVYLPTLFGSGRGATTVKNVTFYVLCFLLLIVFAAELLLATLQFTVQIRNLRRNRTIIEKDYPMDNPYELPTLAENIKGILGKNPMLWFLPIPSKFMGQAGYTYPTRNSYMHV